MVTEACPVQRAVDLPAGGSRLVQTLLWVFFSRGVLATEIERHGVAGRSVLDVGSGSGLLSLAAAQAGGRVTAVDVNPAAVAATAANAAREVWPEPSCGHRRGQLAR